MIALVIDSMAYRLTPGGAMEVCDLAGVVADELAALSWERAPTAASQTNRQMAQLVHIKAALETAETSQL